MRKLLGLRFKIIGTFLLCIALTVFVISYYLLEKERELLTETARQQALSIAGASAILFTNALIYEELDMLNQADMIDYLSYYVDDVMHTDPRILAFVVVDKMGRHVVRAGSEERARQLDAHLESPEQDVQVLGAGFDAALMVAVPLAIESKRWGYCGIIFSLESIENARTTARNEILLISGCFLVLSLCCVGLLVGYQVKSLHTLSEAMESFTVTKDFTKPFPEFPPRNDEIGQLQASFKWMAQRLRREEQERAKTEEQLFHAEKMGTIGQLTASIAHEINNPLGGVMLCFNNLIKGKLDEAARAQHIEVINSAIERIRKTMRDLLDYSRQSTLNIAPSTMDAVIEKCLSLLELVARKRNISISVDLPEDAPLILMDSIKIQQVIVNLLINALHAMPEGGIVEISGEVHEGYFSLWVADSGTGIPDDIQDKIFNPFYTTKKAGEGTGLGLALSRSLVEQHGGQIFLLKSTAAGSVFCVNLPLSESQS